MGKLLWDFIENPNQGKLLKDGVPSDAANSMRDDVPLWLNKYIKRKVGANPPSVFQITATPQYRMAVGFTHTRVETQSTY